MNALCNQRRSPLEHRYIEPGLSSRAGSSMSNKRYLILHDLVLKELLHAVIGFI